MIWWWDESETDLWIDNGFGDEGTRILSEALKTNAALNTLRLRSDKQKDGWGERENEKKMIEYIDNEIGDEGAKMINEALKKNTTLTSIDLWCW